MLPLLLRFETWLGCSSPEPGAGKPSFKKVVAKLNLPLVTDKPLYYSVNWPVKIAITNI
jgi:hypothetical protein